MVLPSISYPESTSLLVSTEKQEALACSYFILCDIVDPRTVTNPNPKPNLNPNPNLEPKSNLNPEHNSKPKPNPNPDPNCGFTIFHKMKCLICCNRFFEHSDWFG